MDPGVGGKEGEGWGRLMGCSKSRAERASVPDSFSSRCKSTVLHGNPQSPFMSSGGTGGK